FRPNGSRIGTHDMITRTKIASTSACARTFTKASRNTRRRHDPHIALTLSRDIEPIARRRGPDLPLIARAELRRPVRPLGRAAEREERQLSDSHSGVQRDRDGVHVRELERDVPVPGGVDEARGAMDEQAEPAQTAFAFDTRDDVVGEADTFAGRAQDELAGMKDERFGLGDLDELGDVVKRTREIDVRGAARPEDAE